jgi:uridine kinase
VTPLLQNGRYMSGKRIMLGIAGPSCSGKTLLAETLVRRLAGYSPCILSLDSYYLDLADLEPAERELKNFDVPSALDSALMKSDLMRLASGGSVMVPLYRFDTHMRAPESEWSQCPPAGSHGCSLVIVEGLFTFHFPEIKGLLDYRIYIDAGRETCLGRRLERDVAERGRSAGSVRRQFDLTVWPMAIKYVLPQKESASMVVDGTDPVEESARRVEQYIEKG